MPIKKIKNEALKNDQITLYSIIFVPSVFSNSADENAKYTDLYHFNPQIKNF